MSITTILGLLMLSLFVVPAYLVIQKQKKDKKKLEKFLSELENEKNIRLSEHETWRNKIIGVDYGSQKALFIIRDKTHNETQIIDLKEISGCSVDRHVVMSETNKSLQAVDAIRIRFKPRNKSNPDQVMTLFSEENDQTLGSELMIAEAWAQKFNQSIRKLGNVA